MPNTYSNFFDMRDPTSNRAFRADLEPSFETALSLTRCESTSSVPIGAFWFFGGRQPGDVIWTGYGVAVILHDRVVEVLRQSRFSGWTVLPCALRGKEGQAISGYSFLQVSGKSGPIDDSLAEVVEKEYPARRVQELRGLYFQPDTWDGSDFFIPKDTAIIMVTKSVRDALKHARVRNVLFTSLSEMQRSLPSTDSRATSKNQEPFP